MVNIAVPTHLDNVFAEEPPKGASLQSPVSSRFSLMVGANRRNKFAMLNRNGRVAGFGDGWFVRAQGDRPSPWKALFGALVVAAILCAPAAVGHAWAGEATATDLRIGVHGERTRVVIDLSGKVEFSHFTLDEPYRLVVDLPEIDWRLAKESGHSGGAVQELRYGRFEPGTSRLVMDLSHPMRVGSAFVLPPSEGKAYRLVLDLVPTDAGTFKQAAGAPPMPPAPPRDASTQKLPAPVPAKPPTAEPGKIAGLSPPGQPGRKPGAGPAKPKVPQKKRVIVIDPGHGGVDPGALAPSGAYEKDITLAAAKEFKRRLDATKRYEVHLTRDRDMFIRLRDRIAIARAKEADLFISLHADTLASSKVRGLSVYTLSEKASDKEAADLAEKENKADLIAGIDLSSENPDVTNILIDLAQRETMNESARFAGALVRELRSVSKVLRQAHRFAGFAVLKAPDVPSVLLEMGFLSNPLDERALTDPAYRGRMADSLVQAVGQFFKRVESAERG